MDVIMPQLGETVSEGTVSVWHKTIGDAVSTKEPLFDVSSDKVEMEVPAPAEGTLLEIRVGAGVTVPVGEVVAIIVREGEVIEVGAGLPEAAEEAAPKAAEPKAAEPKAAEPKAAKPKAAEPKAAKPKPAKAKAAKAKDAKGSAD